GGDATTGPTSSTTYSWSGAVASPGAKTATAYNNAGGTTTSPFTVTADTSAPTAQTAALSGGPYYTALSVPLTLGNGSDTQSGVDSTSGVVERDSAPLTAGACGTYSGSWTTVTLVGGADTSVVSGNCYRYRYKISDNV